MRETTIPQVLIYEMVDNQPIYYRGYKDVLNGLKGVEDIMGSSLLQAVLISRILRVLMQFLSDEQYEIVTNEAGLQLGKQSWRSIDIGIYRKDDIANMILSNSYAKLPPEVVIEVDTKADFEQFTSSGGYYYGKSEALLNFGVKKVIWIFTDVRKVMIARPDQDWLIHGWDKDIQLLDGKTLNLSKIIKK